jgi:hypothetical protein
MVFSAIRVLEIFSATVIDGSNSDLGTFDARCFSGHGRGKKGEPCIIPVRPTANPQWD